MFSARFQMAFRGDLRAYERGVASANTQAIRSVTASMKRQGRRKIVKAGLGTRLANALRSEVRAPNGADLTRRGSATLPVGRVWSNAFVTRKGRKVDLLGDVFEAPVTVQGSPYLAIPTPVAGGRRAKGPESYPAGTFRVVPIKRGRGRPRANAPAFVLIHKQKNEVWFVLIATVRLRKNLQLFPLFRRVAATLPAALERAYARLFKRLKVAA